MSNQQNKQYKFWILPILTGIIFIISGIYIFRTPVDSYMTLATLFAIIFVVSGISEIINAISNRRFQNWEWSLVEGLIDLLFGIILLSSPLLTATFLPVYFGFMIMLRSITGIGHALILRKMGNKSWINLLILDILGVVLALLMIFNPVFGGLTIIYYTAISVIMFGVLQVFFGITLKKLREI